MRRRQSQLLGNHAKTYWLELLHLDEAGKFPGSSNEKVMMASVPSSMELMNDPCVKVRVGIFFRPRPA